MKLPEDIVLFDSLGDIKPNNTAPILVCGSHCGGSRFLAKQVKSCGVRAVFLNNAGVGKNEAGTRGLSHYEAENIIACAVDHNSAEIGVARDTWECGIISHRSPQAEVVGIKIGDSVQEAVAKVRHSTSSSSSTQKSESSIESKEKGTTNKADLQSQVEVAGVKITVTDSITFLNENSSGDVVVCGSHGGVSAGHYAQKHRLKAVFFNDAGIGKNGAGIKSLESLSDAGIIACTVDCMSAEIFNGDDVLNNGVISSCNKLAKDSNMKENMTVREAIESYLDLLIAYTFSRL